MKFLVRLYPRRWRERYGDEFSALLEDVNPDWRTSFDIVKGALVMQMSGWNVGRTLVGSGMIGALVAFAVSFAIPRQYISQAVIKIAPQPGLPSLAPAGINQEMTNRINTLSQTILSRTRITSIISRYRLYQTERSRMPIEDVIEMMRKNIQILPMGGPAPSVGRIPAFVVQFGYEDRYTAQRVVQDLVGRFIDENVQTPSYIRTTLELIDPASLPQNPVSPRVPRIVTEGLVGGLALGGILAYVRRQRRPGGAPVFEGSAVPFQALVDSIESGKTLDQFLAAFPTVTKEAAITALRQLSRAG